MTPSAATTIPVRLCCYQRHWGVVCPDGKVMCCICFGRFDVANLHTFAGDDKPTNVCRECGEQEEGVPPCQVNLPLPSRGPNTATPGLAGS